MAMTKKFPVAPANPERICWGCDKYCPVDAMSCGNGADRTQHPVELFGEDWLNWEPKPVSSAPAIKITVADIKTKNPSDKSS